MVTAVGQEKCWLQAVQAPRKKVMGRVLLSEGTGYGLVGVVQRDFVLVKRGIGTWVKVVLRGQRCLVLGMKGWEVDPEVVEVVFHLFESVLMMVVE